MCHGSEFRPREQLESIVGSHRTSGPLMRTFENGMDNHFVRELEEPERKRDLAAQLAVCIDLLVLSCKAND